MITLRGTVTAVVSRQGSDDDLTSDLQIIEYVIDNEHAVGCTSR